MYMQSFLRDIKPDKTVRVHAAAGHGRSEASVASRVASKDYVHNAPHLFELGCAQGKRHLDMGVAFPFDLDSKTLGIKNR